MIVTRAEAAEYFRGILENKPGWEKLKSSQFVSHLSTFVSWCLREALWRLERLNQEFFVSTALNEASIMAHAEDRGYIPRKRIPATGDILITNIGATASFLPAASQFVSSHGRLYITKQAIKIPAGSSVTAAVAQCQMLQIIVEIAEEAAFFQYVFPLDISSLIAENGIRVEVKLQGSPVFETWSHAPLFQNSWPGSKVYDEFFSHTGQTGIRFGNGIFGMIPPNGTVIQFTLALTEGDTLLLPGQKLFPVNDYAGKFTAIAATAIQGGSERESIESMRINMLYWPSYNRKLVWDDDYVFYIKRNVGGIKWIRVWGEKEQEEQDGTLSVRRINHVYITAYRTAAEGQIRVRQLKLDGSWSLRSPYKLGAYTESNSLVDADIMGLLSDTYILNRHFVFVEPVLTPFSVVVTGNASRSVSLEKAKEEISAALFSAYGKDSETRKDNVFIKDLYAVISSTGLFSMPGARFEVSISGRITGTRLQEMIYLEKVEFNLGHI